MKSLCLALAALALMAGCAIMQPTPDEAHEVAAMLANYERLATLKGEELKREFTAAQAIHEKSPSDTTRLNLALAYLLPRAPWRDDGRVIALLSAIEATPGEQRSPRRDLAQLLLRLLAERQRAQRDEQRRQEQLGNQLREERKKSEESQQKIDLLRSIDKERRMKRSAP